MQKTEALSRARADLVAPAIFVLTIFLSASLLFFVQPLFARIVLPQIGGSPAVWTTAMLFFQTILIGGYLYAHLLTRRLALRAQVWVHLGLWGAALAFLPLGIPDGWEFDASGPPTLQTLALFAAGVGLPFFALSANAPLIQHWYGRSGGPSAEDPYFLYGASNLGSLVALLAFPLVAEPLFGATGIGLGWAAGFVALGGFLLLSGYLAGAPGSGDLAQERVQTRPNTNTVQADAPGWGRIGYWALLAFVPSSLMLAVTTKISLDVGSVPLIWVIPLALYLGSFVLAFSGRRLLGPAAFRVVTGAVLVLMALNFLGLTGEYLTWPAVAILVLGFFVVAIFTHRRLYEARPDSAHLTTFYLTMSVGGALGGLFNSILAPVLFAGLYETLVTVAVAGLLVLPLTTGADALRGLARGAAIGLLAAIPALLSGLVIAPGNIQAVLLFLGMGGLVALRVSGRDGFAIYGMALVLLLVGITQKPDTATFRDRSFFGTHLVFEADGLRLYGNGTTIHGAQRLADDTADRPQPQFYYHPNAPMAQVLTSARGAEARQIGIVGQGVGSLACYARPGQSWEFYEIDRMVDDVARTPHLFRFISSCTPEAPTHLGDARVVLDAQTDKRYDILVIDAYSSDSVPVHLTTREAIALYMDRLAPDGVLVFHISNRYYAIDRPLGRAAESLGLTARIQEYKGNVETDPGDSASTVVTLTRNPQALGELAQDRRWRVLHSDGGRVWTDDYANLLSIMK